MPDTISSLGSPMQPMDQMGGPSMPEPAGAPSQPAQPGLPPLPEQLQANPPASQPASPTAQSACGNSLLPGTQQAASQQPGQQVTQQLQQPGQQPMQQANPPQQQTLLDDVGNQPITDWAKVDLELGDALVDGELVESYGKLACEVGLTPKQARALAHWQLDAIDSRGRQALAEQAKILEREWGAATDANKEVVDNFCKRVARTPGLENFYEEFVRCGAAGNATMFRAMHYISQLLREDSAGRIGGQGCVVESAEEGIRDAFARARGLKQ